MNIIVGGGISLLILLIISLNMQISYLIKKKKKLEALEKFITKKIWTTRGQGSHLGI